MQDHSLTCTNRRHPRCLPNLCSSIDFPKSSTILLGMGADPLNRQAVKLKIKRTRGQR